MIDSGNKNDVVSIAFNCESSDNIDSGCKTAMFSSTSKTDQWNIFWERLNNRCVLKYFQIWILKHHWKRFQTAVFSIISISDIWNIFEARTIICMR